MLYTHTYVYKIHTLKKLHLVIRIETLQTR